MSDHESDTRQSYRDDHGSDGGVQDDPGHYSQQDQQTYQHQGSRIGYNSDFPGPDSQEQDRAADDSSDQEEGQVEDVDEESGNVVEGLTSQCFSAKPVSSGFSIGPSPSTSSAETSLQLGAPAVAEVSQATVDILELAGYDLTAEEKAFG